MRPITPVTTLNPSLSIVYNRVKIYLSKPCSFLVLLKNASPRPEPQHTSPSTVSRSSVVCTHMYNAASRLETIQGVVQLPNWLSPARHNMCVMVRIPKSSPVVYTHETLQVGLKQNNVPLRFCQSRTAYEMVSNPYENVLSHTLR